MDSSRLPSSDHDTGSWQQCMRRVVPCCILVSFFFSLLVSCASPASTQGAKRQALAMPGDPTPTSPQLTQQYEFTVQDSGKTVTYTATSRFGITLNSQKYPKSNMQVSCSPQGTLGSISNIPSVAPPLYAVRYEGIGPGICTIKDGTFFLIVRIVALMQ